MHSVYKNGSRSTFASGLRRLLRPLIGVVGPHGEAAVIDEERGEYKGYHIVTSSSGGASPPYCGSFSVTELLPKGQLGPTTTHSCSGTFPSEQEAHRAAGVAARLLIDSLIAEKSGAMKDGS
jgi:hypothetical protein